MKYVMLLIGTVPCPIVFPDMMTHSLMVPKYRSVRVRSSGFFFVKNGTVETTGTSQSLEKLKLHGRHPISKPHPDDAEILTRFLAGEEALLPFYSVVDGEVADSETLSMIRNILKKATPSSR